MNANVDRLLAWPELWRHPNLFVTVHGSGAAAQQPGALLDALLASETTDRPAEAWAILDTGNLAAIVAAYDQLADHVGVRAAQEDLARARAEFGRRVTRLRSRAQLLHSGGEAIQRTLADVSATVDEDPAAGEAALVQAEERLRAAEAEALSALERTLPPLAEKEQEGAHRLRQAIRDGDLRLARIFAVQSNEVTARTPHELSASLEREPTSVLLDWLLDPTFAPGHAPDFRSDDFDRALLRLLADLLGRGERGEPVEAADVERLLAAALRSLGGAAAEIDTLVERTAGTEDTWAFRLQGRAAARLFPHVADSDDGVAVIAARRPSLHFPPAPPSQPFIALDLFERWKPVARPDVVSITPRLLLKAILVDSAERPRQFIRLQSGTVAVRPLLLSVLGRDEARYRRLLPDMTEGGPVDPRPREPLNALAHALSLYVDQADLAALGDACGDQLHLLANILPILAAGLDFPAGHARRFDALRLLLEGDTALEVDAWIESDLRQRLGTARLMELIVILFDVDTTLNERAGEPASLPFPDLVSGVIARNPSMTELEAADTIRLFLDCGLLRPVPRSTKLAVSRSLPRPGRLMLSAQV